ncbi:MAG: ABC transporter permease [Caldilineaceae bacterium]|nr:ABC transporter permease [Caldilineaceae bacterium]
MSITPINPPVMPTHEQRRLPSHPVQWWNLFLIELTNWRWSWRLTLIAGGLMPLFILFLLGIFAGDSAPDTLAYMLTGNLVIGLLFGTLTRIVNRVEFLRFGGGLDFFATLPVQRFLFVLAMVASFGIFSLPSLVMTLIVGALWLALPLHLHPLLLLVIPLCTMPLAGVGVILGLLGRSWGEASSWSFVVSLLLSVLGPVMIPPDRLPEILVWLGYLSPATYAASALRQVVIGPVSGWILVDLIALAGTSTGLLWWVEQKMSWREG